MTIQNLENAMKRVHKGYMNLDVIHSTKKGLRSTPLLGSVLQRRDARKEAARISDNGLADNVVDVNGDFVYDEDVKAQGWKVRERIGNFAYSKLSHRVGRKISRRAGLGELAGPVEDAIGNLGSLTFIRNADNSTFVMSDKGSYSSLLGTRLHGRNNNSLSEWLNHDLTSIDRALKSGAKFDFYAEACTDPILLSKLEALAFHTKDPVDGLHNLRGAHPVSEKAKDILLKIINAHGKRAKAKHSTRLLVGNFINDFGNVNPAERTRAILQLMSDVPFPPSTSKSFMDHLAKYLGDINTSYGPTVGPLVNDMIMREVNSFLESPFSKTHLGHHEFAFSDPQDPLVTKTLGNLQRIWKKGLPKWKDIDLEKEPLIQKYLAVMSKVPGDPDRPDDIKGIYNEIKNAHIKQRDLDIKTEKLQEEYTIMSSSEARERGAFIPLAEANLEQLNIHLKSTINDLDYMMWRADHEVADLNRPANVRVLSIHEEINIKKFFEEKGVVYIKGVVNSSQVAAMELKLRAAEKEGQEFADRVRDIRISISHANRMLPGYSKDVMKSICHQGHLDANGHFSPKDFFSEDEEFFADNYEIELNRTIVKRERDLERSLTEQSLRESKKEILEEKLKGDGEGKYDFASALSIFGDLNVSENLERLDAFIEKVAKVENTEITHNTFFTDMKKDLEEAATAADKDSIKARIFGRLVFNLSKNQMGNKLFRNAPIEKIISHAEAFFNDKGAPLGADDLLDLNRIKDSFSEPKYFMQFCSDFDEYESSCRNAVTELDSIEKEKGIIKALKEKDASNTDYKLIKSEIEETVRNLARDIFDNYECAIGDMASSLVDKDPNFMKFIQGFLVEFVNAMLQYVGHREHDDSKILGYMTDKALEYQTAGALVE